MVLYLLHIKVCILQVHFMKLFYLLIALFGFIMLRAQTLTPQAPTFNYYSPVFNLDSLEQKLQTTPKDTDAYTDLLIKYDISYIEIYNGHSKYTKELVIGRKKETNPARKAMFDYLFGCKKVFGEKESDILALNDALVYFKTVKDTLGLAYCYTGFIDKNYGTLASEGASKDRAKAYMKKMAVLARESADFRVEILYTFYKMVYSEALGEKESFDTKIKTVQAVIERAKQAPAYRPYLVILYNLEGVLYEREDKFLLALESFEKIEVKEKYESSTFLIKLFNIARVYLNLGETEKAKTYFEKIVGQVNLTRDDLLLLYEMTYKNLGVISEKQDPARAVAYFRKALELSHRSNEIESKNKTVDIQAFLELSQKENELNNISDEKRRIEKQNFQISVLLVLAILFAFFIGLLAYRFFNLNSHLKKITQSRDRLFNIISHDLRSPLTAYIGIADDINFLLKTKQYHRILDLSKQIDVNAQKLDVLLSNLFRWSLLEQEGIKPVLENQNLKNMVTPTLEVYQTIANIKQLNLIIDLPERLDFLTDYNLFVTIIRNLLDNATKYCPANGTVSMIVESSGSKTNLKVSNDCCLDPPPDYTSIVQLINENKKINYGEQNMGMGLLLVKEFSDLLGLAVNFQKDGHRAVFEFKLPV